MKLDELLREAGQPRRAALERARAAARAELRTGKPIVRWTTQLWRLSGATLGLAALTAGVLIAVGQARVSDLAAHLLTLGLLSAVSVATAIAALKPSAPRGVALLLVPAAAAALVALRPEGAGHSPEWVCTLSHLGIGLLPLGVALAQLKSVAPDPKRALLGGLSAGCIGAMLGEVACGRGPLHVAVYHLTAWAVIGVAAVLVARTIKPRSFAP
jgi:hypothetical protein